uniref:Uncharacterized protein n=1 Tax=Anguilla anguilla TaxID=7936 RepID=A0A0E9W3G3_ANGAN
MKDLTRNFRIGLPNLIKSPTETLIRGSSVEKSL